MKATIVLLVLALTGAAAMAALSAQPITPAVTHVVAAATGGMEPAWMVVSGAALLIIASVVKRLGL